MCVNVWSGLAVEELEGQVADVKKEIWDGASVLMCNCFEPVDLGQREPIHSHH